MHICLIGSGLTNLILAKILAKKKINVDLYYNKIFNEKNSSRTISISSDNVNFLEKYFKNIKKIGWPINLIKIYNETNSIEEILEFNQNNSIKFYVFKNNQLFQLLSKNILNNNKIKKKRNNLKYNFINTPDAQKYNLIINSEKNNFIEKKYFYNKYEKNYNNRAYTTIINHKKTNNNIARQIFTRFGPIAFLPVSENKTSLVFSALETYKFKSNSNLMGFLKKYNQNYDILKFEKIESFNLSFLLQRKYVFNNILNFGDNIHKIHPLAGQGFNMNLRNIKNLVKLIDDRIELGLEIDKSIIHDFEKKNKHFNVIFASGVDFLHEFFKLSSVSKNGYTKKLFKILNKNKFFISYATKFADKGLSLWLLYCINIIIISSVSFKNFF